MSFAERVYRKTFQKKAKKEVKEKKTETENDDNYGLYYFENDQDEIYNLAEEFLGKCILLNPSDDDEETQKRNKIRGNEFFQLNQKKQKNICSIEINNEENQQSQENDENYECLDTRSNSNYDDDFSKDDALMVQLSEINYLEKLDNIQKKSVGLGTKKYYSCKQKFNKITKEHLVPQIKKKNILKKNLKA
ncbi:unnamed protein product (macronuclear) [Paramecium tetraurelia]|uniref:Uncharacterized protein n=1 Tax=Paramecium tetraurelia TaxID=5888 RepID=A0CX04_PARTE|nr:uncharacterized protein GSPATT00001524001 [Paramecium tetraurelia]CAK75321.1 unnamed protein product [Paramecium tetraurelia]|eukprot:XP_001442718.1 hypothetical protein (macronuclear) [Paramecium tetraurelia strain d4-2]